MVAVAGEEDGGFLEVVGGSTSALRDGSGAAFLVLLCGGTVAVIPFSLSLPLPSLPASLLLVRLRLRSPPSVPTVEFPGAPGGAGPGRGRGGLASPPGLASLPGLAPPRPPPWVVTNGGGVEEALALVPRGGLVPRGAVASLSLLLEVLLVFVIRICFGAFSRGRASSGDLGTARFAVEGGNEGEEDTEDEVVRALRCSVLGGEGLFCAAGGDSGGGGADGAKNC